MRRLIIWQCEEGGKPVRWIYGIGAAIEYIESNIKEALTINDIASRALLSAFYFQKGFSMLCGFTVGDYIRQRRLTLAGSELVSTDKKIIDIALEYGYDSPDSFTKAFARFHGVTPTAVRRDGAALKAFAPLKITISLKGGYIMDYKIEKKDSFTVMGASKMFKYGNSYTVLPAFWAEHYSTGKNEIVCGQYWLCIDENKETDEFEYLIADNYQPNKEAPPGFVTRVIPAHTWAVFPCVGAMPKALQDVNTKIFSEWLPNSKDYEIAADYNVEMYSDLCDYPKGNQDENYYSEIWIPVKRL